MWALKDGTHHCGKWAGVLETEVCCFQKHKKKKQPRHMVHGIIVKNEMHSRSSWISPLFFLFVPSLHPRARQTRSIAFKPFKPLSIPPDPLTQALKINLFWAKLNSKQTSRKKGPRNANCTFNFFEFLHSTIFHSFSFFFWAFGQFSISICQFKIYRAPSIINCPNFHLQVVFRESLSIPKSPIIQHNAQIAKYTFWQ